MRVIRKARIVAVLAITLSLVGASLAWGPSASAALSEFPAEPTSLGQIPSGGDNEFQVPNYGNPLNVRFPVSGLSGPVSDLAVTFSSNHTFVGDLDVRLFAPGESPSFTIFSRTGATTNDEESLEAYGYPSDLQGPYTFTDSVTANWWDAAASLDDDEGFVVPPGAYRTTEPGGPGQDRPAPVTDLNAAFSGVSNANGTWTLRFRDGADLDDGSVSAASLSIETDPPDDDDNDGVPNTIDECINTPPGDPVGPDGCAPIPGDTDSDGVPDSSDLCPGTPTNEEVDPNGNGCSASQYRPDATIRRGSSVMGDGIRNTDATGQTLIAKVKRRKTASYQIAVQNDSASTSLADTYTIGGCASSRGFKVRYFDLFGFPLTDVTSAVVAGTFTTRSLTPGQSQSIELRIKVGRRGPRNKSCLVTVTSNNSPGLSQDAVMGRVKVRL